MEFKKRVTNTLWSLVLLLCITKVCQGQLMCYVCDNCAQITAKTPQFQCNEDFFNINGPTVSTMQTTTELTKTTPDITEVNNATTTATTTTDETTLTPSTANDEETTLTSTTVIKSTESTTKVTTENTTETSTDKTIETALGINATAEDQPPTPPTVGPPKTSADVPTPPNLGTVRPLDDIDTLNNQNATHHQHTNRDEVEDVDIEQITTKAYKPSAEFRIRQFRSVTDVTFHCFKVQATVNGTMVVNRGCARVQTNESVCGQWESQHRDEKMNKCYPCSRTKCNGSSTLTVSITALFVAIVALFLHRK